MNKKDIDKMCKKLKKSLNEGKEITREYHTYLPVPANHGNYKLEIKVKEKELSK